MGSSRIVGGFQSSSRRVSIPQFGSTAGTTEGPRSATADRGIAEMEDEERKNAMSRDSGSPAITGAEFGQGRAGHSVANPHAWSIEPQSSIRPTTRSIRSSRPTPSGPLQGRPTAAPRLAPPPAPCAAGGSASEWACPRRCRCRNPCRSIPSARSRPTSSRIWSTAPTKNPKRAIESRSARPPEPSSAPTRQG